MELRHLRVLVEVVRHGGFTGAAKAVFATQSTVSKSIKQLEDELGVRLIDRSGSRSTLTDAGEIVYRRAIGLLAERDDLLGELDEWRGLKRGTLRVGLPAVGSDALFAPIFATFRSRYRQVDIRLIEGGSRHLEEVLRAGEVELAGLLQPVPAEFAWRPLRREPIDAVVARSHPLAGRREIDLAELADESIIQYEDRFTMHDLVNAACAQHGFVPQVIVKSSQMNFMLELAAGGIGVTFAPRLLAVHPAIVTLPLRGEPMAWDMTLAWRHGAYLSQAAKAWLAIVDERMTP